MLSKAPTIEKDFFSLFCILLSTALRQQVKYFRMKVLDARQNVN